MSRDNAEPHARFQRVTKSYDNAANAVDAIDLDIARGEFLTLLGPSGSGKTTSLMMLAGFEDPTEGSILLNGRRIDHTPPYRRGIGVVFQNYALFPHMTVAGNLAFPLEVRGIGRAEREASIKRLVERVRLQGLEDRYPSQLSGGQQQRVAVARSLVFGPELVLMDEPLGALDKQLRERLQYEIKEIHNTFGVTIVYVTHDQSEALTMSDRIALFHAGRLEQVAGPQTIYQQPATRFAAHFIGETNSLSGTVLERLSETDVAVALPAGATVRATIRNIAGHAGEATSLCIRPEHVRLETREDSTRNTLRGTVKDSIFHGDHVRVHILLEGGETFLTRLPADRIGDVNPGTGIAVHFAPQHCLALDADLDAEPA